MHDTRLAEFVRPAGRKAGKDTDPPVYSVTKHAGFVPSLEYFKKQVFSRDVEGYKLVEPGDFAYATIHLDEGSIGIAPERALISPMYTVFSVDEKRVDSGYLIRFLKSPRALAFYPTLGRGAVHRRKSISLAALGQLGVPLPSIAEQRRIAAILDHADDLRFKRRQVLTHHDALTQSIFQRFFDHDPLSYELLGEVAQKVVVGHVGPTQSHFREFGVPFLRTGNIGNGEVVRNGMAYVTTEFHQSLRKSQLQTGDVLISRVVTDEVRAAILPSDLDGANCANVIIVRPSKRMPAHAVLGFLALPSTQRRLLGRRVGSAQSVVYTTVLKELVVPVHATNEHALLGGQLSKVWRVEDAARRTSMAEEELFTSLQSRAFKGEL